jgi:hypothetical protein
VLLCRASETSSNFEPFKNASYDRPTILVNGHLYRLRAKAADRGSNPWNFRVKDADHGCNLCDAGYAVSELYSDAMCWLWCELLRWQSMEFSCEGC